VTGNYTAGQSAKILTYGRWDSENPIPGPLGVRYLSITTPGEMTEVIPPQTHLVALGFKVSSHTFIIRIGGSAVQHLLSFVDYPFIHGVLMLKKGIHGSLTIPSGYTAVEFEDATVTGSITFQPNSELVLLPRRTPNYLEWVVSGLAMGWNEEVIPGNGSLQYPQFRTFTNGNEIIRLTYVYNGNNNYLSITYEYSKDSGTTWAQFGTKNFVYSGLYLTNTYWT
jgi:hypothetical protein